MSDLEIVLEAINRLQPDEIERVKVYIEQHNSLENQKRTYPRIPGLHRGMVWMSDDFNDALPDEFWLGEE